MFRFLMGLMICCGLLSASDSATPQAITWMTNYNLAATQAKESGKPLLLFFTGSDWCVWCIKAEKEIFSTPEFTQAAGDKFVFVKVDFPLNQDLSVDQVAQNEKLKNQYSVRAFPTMVLVSPSGTVLATTGYAEGGGAKYAAMLLKLAGGTPS